MKTSRSYDPYAALDVRSTVPLSRSNAALTTGNWQAHAPSLLERRYPQMARAISLLWGYPEMNAYFGKLWLPDGKAEPIDPEVMADLMLLARLHMDIMPTTNASPSLYGRAYPQRPGRTDVWADVPGRR
jgi:hypothetical protein